MTTASKLQTIHIAMIGLCLASHVAASESTISESELYTPLVNAYESDLLEKRAALSKCVTTACKVYAQLDITRLSSKLAEIKAIYAHMIEAKARLEACPQTHVTRCINPEKALVQSLSNEIYAAKEGK
jgi:glutaminase